VFGSDVLDSGVRYVTEDDAVKCAIHTSNEDNITDHEVGARVSDFNPRRTRQEHLPSGDDERVCGCAATPNDSIRWREVAVPFDEYRGMGGPILDYRSRGDGRRSGGEETEHAK